MSSIQGLGGTGPVQQPTSVTPKNPANAAATEKPTLADRLELSGVSHLFQALKTNDVRADKVADVKAQIQAGTYETDDKLNGATNKLLDEVLK